jgi:RNA polymerase primary sigma factor
MAELIQPSLGGGIGRLTKTGTAGSSFSNKETTDYHERERHYDEPSVRVRENILDRTRLTTLKAGDPATVAEFLKDISATVWTACRLLTCDDRQAREAFAEIMAKLRVDRFARLSSYSGRGSLDAFVALTVRDLLAERMLRLFQSDGDAAWRAFERFFEDDILKLIRRHFPGPANEDLRNDAYQEVCVALIDSNYRRLKAYDGSGSFAGFVLRMCGRLVIDFLRRAVPRRRLPAAVARQGALDREIYSLVYWQQLPQRPEILAAHLQSRLQTLPDEAEIAAALARLKVHAPAQQEGVRTTLIDSVADVLMDDTELSPEEQLLQSEKNEQLDAALHVLTRAVETLPAAERLYLTIILSGAEPPPSRDIARLMQRPVEDIYKLKQRVLNRLREVLSEESAVKTWHASV